MEVRATMGANFSLSNYPPAPGKVSMMVRWAKTRLQNRAMASLPRWMMLPSSASEALSVMPSTAFRSARAISLVVLGAAVTVMAILLMHVSRETICPCDARWNSLTSLPGKRH
jgi:hypothetical protein